MANPFTGYPLAGGKSNATPRQDDHPAHHNALAAGLNELQDTVTVLTGRIGSAYAEVTADQGTFTGETDLTGLAATVTPGAGRRLKITASVRLQSSIADDELEVRIKEGATVLNGRKITPGPANRDGNFTFSAIVTPSAAAHTYKLSALRATGTGNVTMKAAAGAVSSILVEDVT